MQMNLAARSALVTGASQGIGLAIAEALAAEGCHLHLAARNGPAMEATRERLSAAHGVRVTVHTGDLSESGAMERLAGASAEADILVNNAGDMPSGPLDTVDDAAWRRGFDLKVFGYVALARAFYTRFKRNGGGGVIVNIIGSAGENWDANYVAGTTGNAALMAFTKALGSTSLDLGIRVVGINPGPVATDRLVRMMKRKALDRVGDEARWQDMFDRFPGKRPATPDAVADLAVFLASPRAAFISGTIVTIDSGLAALGAT